MFHIPISSLKYLCANKYTFCFILIGEKRLGRSEHTRDALLKEGNRGHHKLRMWKKERWLRLSPQQEMCMLWKNNLVSPVTVPKGLSRTCFVVMI
ncbi:hypothetical protein AB205_0092240 [Aquarana catesbeiana]|uniref:Uncharacterized protein n=1 Tax=Aquarana catesbeiana TaxID=8400 RepID=A0A2G9QK36_AQUCT|nr:hypothetical protein AB205_0092240 [Aquarana catesbeiana]